jgi:hypothetical protein
MTKALFIRVGFVGYEINNAGTTIGGARAHGKRIERKNFVSKFVATLGAAGATRHKELSFPGRKVGRGELVL